MKNTDLSIPLLFLALALILAACASPAQTAAPAPTSMITSAPVMPTQTSQLYSTPTIATTATSAAAPTAVPLPSPTENTIHSLGQLVKTSGLTLALIGADYTPAQLQVTFVAKNTGAAVVDASFIDFSASGTDGKALKTDACFTVVDKTRPDYAVPSFGGSLQPGENLRGTICWKSADPNAIAPAPQSGIQVSYTPEGSLKPIGIWDVSSAGKLDAPAELATSDFSIPPHAQGEAVALKDITITFDRVTYQGVGLDKTRVVMAHFTLENKGAGGYQFGEFLSYSFSVKLADGSPLGTDFMTLGCQNTNSKVEILPAQKRSMTICFVNPGTSALPPGSLAIFIPNPDQGAKVFWVTK